MSLTCEGEEANEERGPTTCIWFCLPNLLWRLPCKDRTHEPLQEMCFRRPSMSTEQSIVIPGERMPINFFCALLGQKVYD